MPKRSQSVNRFRSGRFKPKNAWKPAVDPGQNIAGWDRYAKAEAEEDA